MAEFDRAEISTRIRQARKQAGFRNRQEFADLLHVHWRTINLEENQMRTPLIVTAVAVAAFALGSVATAAISWRTFATASDKGEYGTYASADAKVVQPNGLAIRASGKVSSVNWFLSCSAAREPAKPGVFVVSVATADTCSLSGSAVGPGGTTKIELLKR
jgi:DNA-binding XRE family transcriptional regulator